MTLETNYPRPQAGGSADTIKGNGGGDPYPLKTVPEHAVLALLQRAIIGERHVADMQRTMADFEKRAHEQALRIADAKRETEELFRTAVELDPRLKGPDGGVDLRECYGLYQLGDPLSEPLQHISV